MLLFAKRHQILRATPASVLLAGKVTTRERSGFRQSGQVLRGLPFLVNSTGLVQELLTAVAQSEPFHFACVWGPLVAERLQPD